MANGVKTYRHAKTGVVTQFPVSAARHIPDLIEVAEDAKPLAYTPIPDEKVEAVRAAAPVEPVPAKPSTFATSKKAK